MPGHGIIAVLGHAVEESLPEIESQDPRCPNGPVDHHAIPGEVYDELRRHFDDASLTELLWVVAIARGLARIGAVLGVPA